MAKKQTKQTYEPTVIYNEFGQSILANKGGFRARETELLPQLKGLKARKVYQEMADNNPNISGMIYAIEMLLRSVEWNCQPSEADGTGEFADFAEDALENMEFTLPEVITEILTMLVFGFSCLEMVFKVDPSGFVGIHKLAPRPQVTITQFVTGERGDILGIKQAMTGGANGNAFIPYSKLLHFRTKLNGGNPEGKSLLRGAYTSYYAATKLNEVEAIAFERELTGVPIITAPFGDLEANKAIYERMGANLKANSQGAFVIPSDTYLGNNGAPSAIPQYDIKLIASAGTRNMDINAAINRHELNILRSLLATFISLGSSGGSNALSKDQTDFFIDACQGYLASIACEFNEKLLPTLWLLNGFEPDTMPKLVPSKLKQLDLIKFAEAYTKLSAAGVYLQDEAAQNMARASMGLPDVTPEMLSYEQDVADPEL